MDNGNPNGGQFDELFMSTQPPGGLPRFRDESAKINFAAPEQSGIRYPRFPYRTHGTAFVDVNGDGLPEIAVSEGGPAAEPDYVQEPDRLFQLDLTPAPHWLRVQPVGDGARILRDRLRFAQLEHVDFKLLKADFALFDFLADARVPRAVPLLHKLSQPTVFANRRCDFQPARERVHAADVRIEQIYRLEAFAPHLGVEIRPARREAAHFQNGQHDVRGEINVGRELVGVPAEEQVAGIGVDRAERVGRGGDLQFVLHGVAGERGVVRFKVELEMADQVVFTQEVQAGRGVRIVLMLGWFFRFRFDIELPVESDFLFVLHCHVQERREMVHLPFEIGVQQSGITFASAPENITFTVEFVGDFQRLLHLRRGVSEHVRVATGGRAVDVARMREQTSRAPKQFHPGALLFLFQHLDDRIQVFVGFPQVLAFGRDIAVVKGVKRRAELLDELKGHTRAVLGVLH